MRKLTVALLFVIAVLLAGRFWQELNSIANAGGDDPISTLLNGDVNGDQMLDMSDAVFLLIHLFNGGPDPVAFGDTPEMLDRVSRLEDGLLGMAEAQATLEEDFRDLTENLRSRASDVVLFADGVRLSGTAIIPEGGGSNCWRVLTDCEEAGFESAEILEGGEISEEDGRLYFNTDHQADLLVELPLGGIGSFSSIFFDGDRSQKRIDGGGNGYMQLVLHDLPAGQHYIEVSCRVMFRMTVDCKRCPGRPRDWSAQIPSMIIHYLN